MNLLEEFEIHEELNPKIWDNNTMTLLPEVREKILEIVDYFEQYVEVPISIVDVQIVGSNASFNYTEQSDLDVHVICNFEVVTGDVELLQTLYNMKKTQFNKNYDISIHGIDIEMYIQDIRSNITSNGIFSVCDNQWIKEPKPIKSATKHNTEKEVEKWTQFIQNTIMKQDYTGIANAINALYLMRKNSIAVDGEYGKGNEIFKQLRNDGLLSELKDALERTASKQLSLESYSGGQIVNRYE